MFFGVAQVLIDIITLHASINIIASLVNVLKLGSIKSATSSKNVRSCFREFIYEACTVEEILIESNRNKIHEFDETDDGTAKAKR